MTWIETLFPAPILNTADFLSVFGGTDGQSIPLNQDGHPYHYEFIALQGMQFECIGKPAPFILEIRWPSYSFEPLFIDLRFCKIALKPSQYKQCSYTADYLLDHMESRIGTPYIWGGNYAFGIPSMLEYYPPKGKIDARTEELWTFRGLDCSGLLFEASYGTTPRNTSHLLKYGRSLRCNEEILPLDMIIYPGHVLFVRDKESIIESKSPFGVRICPLHQRLDEISQERTYVREWDASIDPNLHFTIRRFL